MALFHKATQRSQHSISNEEMEQLKQRITLNSVATTYQQLTAVGKVFNNVKDECRFLGDYAFKHFYIDYDLQREKKFTWESITNNLLNS